jgi:hypothetical protein
LTDTGGETENYSDNENFIQYICPDGPDKKVVITFTQFGVEEDYDVLYIYDGPSISSPLFLQRQFSDIIKFSGRRIFWQ